MLGRPVWTHEFASVSNLLKEDLGVREKPTLEEIIGLFPDQANVIPIIIDRSEVKKEDDDG